MEQVGGNKNVKRSLARVKMTQALDFGFSSRDVIQSWRFQNGTSLGREES